MRKTKKTMAMLMAAAISASPCAAGQTMYEVHAEEAETLIQEEVIDETSDGSAGNGESGVTAAQTEEEDKSVPEIMSLKRITSGDIYSNTSVQYEVGYKEEGSGIRRIELFFLKDGENIVDVYTYEGETGAVGMNNVTIQSENREPGQYHLDSIEIEDYAGNRRSYRQDEAGTSYTDIFNDSGENKSVEVSEADRSYEVKFKPYDGVMLKGVKAVLPAGMDKDKLAAEDVFEVVATVVNNSASEKLVNPEACAIIWNKTGNASWDCAYGSGQSYMLAPDAEGEIHFKVQVNPFAVTGKRELGIIDIRTSASDKDGLNYSYSSDTGKLTALTINAEGVPSVAGYLDYGREIDYTVTESKKPDEEAPYLEKISVNTRDIKAPGKVSFDIHIPDEGFAKVKEIDFLFKERENAKNILYWNTLYSGKFEYSTEKKCYVYEVELNPSTTKGTYELITADVIDEAGNGRHYEKNAEGMLIDTDHPKNVLEPCEVAVVEAESEDYDFDAPVLKNIVLADRSVKNGEKVRFEIEAEDGSGLAFVSVIYKDIKTGEEMELRSRDIEKEENGYQCSFIVDKYCESGDYRAVSVWLADGSERENGVMYIYDQDTQTLYPQHEGSENVVLKESLDLKVTGSEDMVVTNINKENVSSIADSVKQGGTIVVKGADIEESKSGAIPKELFKKAKEKELTVIIPDKNSNSEIVVNGRTLADVPGEDTELKVQRGVLNEEEITVGSVKDNIYYPVDVVVSDTKLPFTLRIRLDGEFLEQSGNRPIRFSKVAADGSSTILEDNVKADTDGYLEVSFQDGIGASVNSQAVYTGRNEGDIQGKISAGTRFIVSSRAGEDAAGTGDINADGKVDILDLMLCLNHVSRKSELSGDRFQTADIDGNGKVDLLDLMRILNYVSKKTGTV